MDKKKGPKRKTKKDGRERKNGGMRMMEEGKDTRMIINLKTEECRTPRRSKYGKKQIN